MKASFELIYGGLEFLVLTRKTRIHANQNESRPLKAAVLFRLSRNCRTVTSALAVGSGEE